MGNSCSVVGQMAGEGLAQGGQGGVVQAGLEQGLGLAVTVVERVVDHALHRAAAAGLAGAGVQQRRRTDGHVHVIQRDLRRFPGQLAAAAMATHAGDQPALVQSGQQAPDHHRMGWQAGGELLGGARAVLADQMGHHVQRVRELVTGFHVTTVVT